MLLFYVQDALELACVAILYIIIICKNLFPSFSANISMCNIEKVGNGPGDEADVLYLDVIHMYM